MYRVVRVGLCALVAVSVLAFSQLAAASDPRLPPQGLYEWCDPSRSPDACAERLRRIGEVGFRAINNAMVFNNASAEQLRGYARAADEAGVDVIWPLNVLQFQDADPNGNNLLSVYPNLAQGCGCSTNQGLLAHLIGILRGLPNTWGYYLADEPSPTAEQAMVTWVSRIKALDPSHPRIIMGCGVCEGGPDAHVTWLTGLDVAVGTDAYPVFGGAPDPARVYASVQQNVATVDRAATSAGRQQVVALQAWRWGDSAIDSQAARLDPAATRFPTREEIQAQRDATIENAHADLILWFTLTQVIGWVPGQNGPGWSDPPDPAQRWANLIGGAFAPLPSAARPAAAVAQATSAPRNRSPRARFTIRRGPASHLGRRVIANAGNSVDPDGRILSYVWRLNGRRLAGTRSRRRAFHVRPGRGYRLTLTVSDDRGARSTAGRRFRIPRRPRH